MINNKLKGLNCVLLLVRSVAGLLNQNSQKHGPKITGLCRPCQKVVPLYIGLGDYRYTELSYKITSLISRTCCLGSSGLTYT